LSGACDNSGHSSDYRVVSAANREAQSKARSSGRDRSPIFPAFPSPKICKFAIRFAQDPRSGATGDRPQKDIANTVVFIKNIPSGKAFDLPSARRLLDQHICRYEPHILLLPEHAALPMKSSGATLDTIHMDSAATYNLPLPFTSQTVFPRHEYSRIGRPEMQWRICLDECRDVRGAPSVLP
jgi:hypothetical protein